MYGNPVGTVNISSAGAIITASTFSPVGQVTAPGIRVFNIHLISGGTPSVFSLTNGNAGTTFVKVTGTANTGATFDFGVNGVFFPSGAFAVVDGNIVSATIACRIEYS